MCGLADEIVSGEDKRKEIAEEVYNAASTIQRNHGLHACNSRRLRACGCCAHITIYRIPHDFATNLASEPELKQAGIYRLVNT